MKIAHREISPGQPPLVIAEIGINHRGDLAVAKTMVRLAAAAGCEMIKHQTHIVEDEMTEEAKQIFRPNADVSIWHLMECCALSLEDELKRYTESLRMIWVSKSFSRADADFLETLDVPAYKIVSREADNIPLLRHIARKKKPVILSTGMQTIETIRASVEILQASCVEFALLECTNLYPSPPEIVSLKGVTELHETFPGVPVGFSDHSIGPDIALASVALGACILERTTQTRAITSAPRSSTRWTRPNFATSSTARAKSGLRPITQSAAQRRREPVYRFGRASVVADANLPRGHVMGEQDIWARRPGSGEIAGHEFVKVVGKRLTHAVSRNTQLKWEDLK